MTKYILDDDTQSVQKESTGEMYHVSCYSDLKLYLAYVIQKHKYDAGQKMLKNVFNGEKVMNMLVEQTQRGF